MAVAVESALVDGVVESTLVDGACAVACVFVVDGAVALVVDTAVERAFEENDAPSLTGGGDPNYMRKTIP